MRLILDSHILVAISLGRLHQVSFPIAECLKRPEIFAFASVASLWEIAIKTRLGKLDPGLPLASLPLFYEALGMTLLPISSAHALACVEPVPPTRDPFDRMLLAQCQVEACRLATLDHALRDHPLAARFP
ncbi:MAG: type II toxin-antitoxin system VapC family toxin [Methylobacterium sp.]|uniref:type II toxin-antitoxin system VapC family toxin n=1 Tax=Methylobacterium sp. TaxID=409 RepID=UPI002728D996|nr:type II toxin-antitoxin system VapC family toxin [Methylobacterium sp.]MDO9426004.1 type II toxin-antitoxin system VapC family toxin [Methylobacterium sp.]